jgi:hypothetical protein
MSKIAQLIGEKKSGSAKLVASTVRISAETHSFVEELADQLGLSKQETLAVLIDDGVSAARKALKLDEPEESTAECSFHLLNTNKRNSVEDSKRMLAEGIAAAFYAPWKYSINRIKKGDIVFLYENGIGVVAYGRASGETLVRDYNGDADEFHYQSLSNFSILQTPMKASEIRKVLSGNIVFLRTMVSIADGDKLLAEIESKNLA